jgi:hypothetical protein
VCCVLFSYLALKVFFRFEEHFKQSSEHRFFIFVPNSMVNCIAGLLPNLFPHPLALPNVHAMLLPCKLPKAVVPV